MPEDKARAVALYTQAAQRGNLSAQCNLGYCCLTGIGMDPAPEQAIPWLERAAEQGSARAMSLLGSCLPGR
ncbi:MAG: tetratricopeptide repeat protein [Intestinimonas sp.]